MKQLLQSLKTGELAVEEVPVPELQPNGVLVRNYYSLISAGTEKSKVDTAGKSLIGKALERPDQVIKVLETFTKEGLESTIQKVMSRLDTPSALGYSSAGVVIAVGSNVTWFKEGDIVACAGAGYANHAEVVYIPANLCAKVPEGVDLSFAAATTLGAIAMQGIRQSGARFGDNVCVIGLGLIGQLTVQMLKAAGCTVLAVDIDETKCDLAGEFGAEYAGVSGRDDIKLLAGKCSKGFGVDSVIITAGTSSNAPIELAGDIVRKKGKVVVVGAVKMDIPRSPYYQKEIDICLSCSYGPGRYDVNYEEKGQDYPIGYVRWTEKRNMEHFLKMLSDGTVNLDRIITHRFKFDEAGKAYDLIKGEIQEKFIGILLEYDKETEVKRKINLGTVLHFTDKVNSRTVPKFTESTGTVRLGLIGAGSYAKGVLLPALKKMPEIEFHGVMTATGITAKGVAKNYGFKYCVSDVEELLNDKDINTILIATRHDTHAELVTKALKAGKNVFVEKPLALNQEELTEIVRTVGEIGGKVMVGFNRRFSPYAVSMYEFFKDRTGPMVINYRVNAGRIKEDHWIQDPVQGGGRIVGEGCHFIDFMQYMTGELPVKVFAAAVEGSGKNTFDTVNITVVFSRGSIGTLSYLANGDTSLPKEYIEVFCEGKTVVLNDFNELKIVSRGKTRTEKKGHDKGQKAELQALADAVTKGTPMPISFESLILTALTTFKVHDSLRSGNVVDIDE